MAADPVADAPPSSFDRLVQRAEIQRIQLWATVLIGILSFCIGRRLLDGVVMTTNRVFWPSVTVIGIALLVQALAWRAFRVAERADRLLKSPLASVVIGVDLGVPTTLLAILAWHSPRGPLEAVTAPALLLLPLLTLLSVLRLRPGFTLATGLAGAVFHAVLVLRALAIEGPPIDHYLIYLDYSLMLALMALAGMWVARQARSYVRQVAEETAARHRSALELAAVNRDLAIAHEIQQGLLPAATPNFPGFDIAGMSRPANQAGGDYYDWQLMPDGRLILCLADVSGHGIGPALVMAVCRAYARASAELMAEPSALMRRINQLLEPDLPADRFITLIIAELWPDGRLQLVSAGHAPTLRYEAATAQIQEYGSHGLPLGIHFGFGPTPDYEPTTRLHMAEGDVLLLLTDGFYEWERASDGEQVGIARIAAMLRQGADASAANLLSALDRSCSEFVAGQPQQDDMTAVVVKRIPISRQMAAE